MTRELRQRGSGVYVGGNHCQALHVAQKKEQGSHSLHCRIPHPFFGWVPKIAARHFLKISTFGPHGTHAFRILCMSPARPHRPTPCHSAATGTCYSKDFRPFFRAVLYGRIGVGPSSQSMIWGRIEAATEVTMKGSEEKKGAFLVAEGRRCCSSFLAARGRRRTPPPFPPRVFLNEF